MPKNKISEFSSTPANNTDIGGIDIAEGCAPSGINNSIRELMAQLKDMITGADGDSQVVGGNLSVSGTTTLTTALPVTSGGTGASTASNARTNLGLGTMAIQEANAVAITGGAIANSTISGTRIIGYSPNAGSSGAVTLADATGNPNAIYLQATNNATTSQYSTLYFNNNGTISASGTFSATSFSGAGTGLTGTANSLSAGIGVNQTWQNMTSSRAFNDTYPNNTGKPIFVSVLAGGNSKLSAFVNGAEIQRSIFTTGNTNTNVAFIVPNGNTYSITSSVGALILWTELR